MTYEQMEQTAAHQELYPTLPDLATQSIVKAFSWDSKQGLK